MEDYSEEESDVEEFPREFQGLDKESEVIIPNGEFFSRKKEDMTDLDVAECLQVLSQPGTFSDYFSMIIRLIKYMDQYDIDFEEEDISEEYFNFLCGTIPPNILNNDKLLHQSITFFYMLWNYEDPTTLQGKMCTKIFSFSSFLEKLHSIIDKDIKSRNMMPEGTDTITFKTLKLIFFIYKRTPNFDCSIVNIHKESSDVLKLLKNRFINPEEKVYLFRTIKKLTKNYRNAPCVDGFIDFLKETQGMISDDIFWDREYIKFIKSLICKPEYVRHILFDSTFLDGNPFINFINKYLNGDDLEARMYANKLYMKVLITSYNVFIDIDYDFGNLFSLVASDDEECSLSALNIIEKSIKSSVALEEFYSKQVLELLGQFYDSMNYKSKMQTFRIFYRIICRKNQISPEFIGDFLIPLCIDRLQIASYKELHITFSMLTKIFSDDSKREDPFRFTDCFIENGGVEAVDNAAEDTEDKNIINDIEKFKLLFEKQQRNLFKEG